MRIKQISKNIKRIFKIDIFRGGNIISYIEAKDLIRKNCNTILLDIRSNQEYNEYHLDGAINIPLYELRTRINKIVEDKSQIIIVYCQSGGRSRKAINILIKCGYTNLYEIDGGIDNI